MQGASDRVFLDIPLAEKYFSHVFAEAGFIDEIKPLYKECRYQTEDRIFDLASLTKALVTAPLIYQLVEEGKIALGDKLGRFLTGFPVQVLNKSIGSLLAHQSGLPAWRNFWINYLGLESPISQNRNDVLNLIREVFKRTDLKEMGVRETYSDLGFILLGCVLEVVHKQSLSDIFNTFLKSIDCQDLDMSFPISREDSNIFISTSYCRIRRQDLKGQVHDENCAALGGVSGHAGLFSSGPSLSAFLKSFIGSDLGRSFYQANYQALVNNRPLLGLRPGDDLSSSVFGRGQSLGHLGFTGTSYWVDWEKRTYGIYLTNRIMSSRVSSRIKVLRMEAFKYMQERLDLCQKEG